MGTTRDRKSQRYRARLAWWDQSPRAAHL